MLGRGVARTLPLRSLFPRLPGARTARTVRPSRRMSVGADAEPQPPAKMARLEETLRVKKISEHAILPVRGSDGAAGYDLAAAYDCGTHPHRPARPAAERYSTLEPPMDPSRSTRFFKTSPTDRVRPG